jgi:hypothetical protein
VNTPRFCQSSSLVYLKTYALQVVQGRLFGMGQSKANQWIHVLLPALLTALRSTLGDAPARSLTALAQRLGVSEADAATIVSLLEEPVPLAPAPASPLLPMTAPNDASSAPKTLLNRPCVAQFIAVCSGDKSVVSISQITPRSS